MVADVLELAGAVGLEDVPGVPSSRINAIEHRARSHLRRRRLELVIPLGDPSVDVGGVGDPACACPGAWTKKGCRPVNARRLTMGTINSVVLTASPQHARDIRTRVAVDVVEIHKEELERHPPVHALVHH